MLLDGTKHPLWWRCRVGPKDLSSFCRLISDKENPNCLVGSVEKFICDLVAKSPCFSIKVIWLPSYLLKDESSYAHYRHYWHSIVTVNHWLPVLCVGVGFTSFCQGDPVSWLCICRLSYCCTVCSSSVSVVVALVSLQLLFVPGAADLSWPSTVAAVAQAVIILPYL